jgi:hypothetical protein
MRIFAPALCASLALFSGSALAAPTAAPTGVAADARCLLAMAALSGSKDPKQSESAQAGMVYYAGRIRAREPSFDFSTRLKAVAATMNREAVVAEVPVCGNAMTTSLRDLDNGLKTLSQAPAGAAKPGAAAPPKP